MPKNASPQTTLPAQLGWLADAPLFIDTEQVARFYDAVVRPDKKEGKTTLEVTKDVAGHVGAKLGLGATLSPNDILQHLMTVLPFLKAEITAEVEGTGQLDFNKTTSKILELHDIDTPQRQLEQLTLHYLINLPKRLFFVSDPAEPSWRRQGEIVKTPRAMAFLDLPPGVKLIPTAAEFENGKIELIYERLKSADGRESPPRYPELEQFPTDDERSKELKKYWQWFNENFSSTKTIIAIEKVAEQNGRLRWIDYRLPVNAAGDTVHLHLMPRGHFDTGVFAYNFVKRGYKHGIRLVGTLKSEPDLNVLAIYDV
jgi:hypothetical protein